MATAAKWRRGRTVLKFGGERHDLRQVGRQAKLPGSKPPGRRNGVGRDRRPIQDPDKPAGQFGAFLDAELVRRGWSVDEFQKKLAAKKLDKTDDTIRNWLTGSNSPRIPELANIAAALGYDDWLAMLTACRKQLTASPKRIRK